MTTLLITNITLADLLITFIEFIPTLMTLLSGEWVLGGAICTLVAYTRYFPFVVECLLTATMACHRLYVLLRPAPLRKSWFVGWVVGVWILPLANISYLLAHHQPAHFNPGELSCTSYNYTDPGLIRAYSINAGVIYSISLLPTILSNLAILTIVARYSWLYRRRLPDLPIILATVGVSAGLLVAYMPTLYSWFTMHTCTPRPNRVLVDTFALSINVVTNPIIFMLTNRRLRQFIGYFTEACSSCEDIDYEQIQ